MPFILYSYKKRYGSIESHPHEDVRKSWLCASRSERCDPCQVPPPVLQHVVTSFNKDQIWGKKTLKEVIVFYCCCWNVPTHPKIALQWSSTVSLDFQHIVNDEAVTWKRRNMVMTLYHTCGKGDYGLKTTDLTTQVPLREKQLISPHRCLSEAPLDLVPRRDGRLESGSHTERQK